MDRELIVRLSALTKGPLLTRRKEIREAFVCIGLSQYAKGDIFEAHELIIKVKALANVKMDVGVAVAVLEDLASQGYVCHISEFKYKLENTIKIPEFRDLTQDVWDEFVDFLKIQYREYDPFLDKILREIIDITLYNLSLRILQSQDTQLDSLPEKDFKGTIEKSALECGIAWPGKIADIFYKYLISNSPCIVEFIYDTYEGLINFDIISREQEIPEIDLSDSIGFILLDTSFLVPLMCKTDPIHALTAAVSAQCAKRNIPLYYIDETKKEMWRAISGSKMEMNSGLVVLGDPRVISSQFVKDYHILSDLSDGADWKDYFAELANWENLIKIIWNISQMPEKVNLNEDVFHYVKKMLPLLDQSRSEGRLAFGKGPRDEKQIEHDAICLGSVAGARKVLIGKSFMGPWFLTFDNQVFAVSEFYHHIDQQHFGLAIQPRRLLNYLMAFAKTEFDEVDRKSVAEAIIRFTARAEKPKIDLRSYSRLIAPKLELGSEDTDLLLEMFLKTPLRAELEKALERDSGGDAERLVQRIITDEDFVKEFIGQRQVAKDLDHARKTIAELNSKYRASEAARNSLERSVGHKVTIEVVTTVELNLQMRVNALIYQLESELPDGFEKHGLPEPPKVVTRIGKLKGWLTSLKEAIDASKTVTEAVKLSVPIIELLIKNLNNIS